VSKMLKLAELLEEKQAKAEVEADEATGSDEHLVAVAEANAYGDAARLVREVAAKDAAEAERLRSGIKKLRRSIPSGRSGDLDEVRKTLSDVLKT